MAIRYSGQFTVRKQRKRSSIGRFIEKIRVNPERMFEGTPCWEWASTIDDGGYGRFKAMGENYAHRVAYKLFVGKLSSDHDVDHRCRNRACESPFHLQAVSHQKNMRLMADANEHKTHCKNGHEFDGSNTHINKRGDRVCKACRYEAIKRWRERHPDKAKQIGQESKASWRAQQRADGRVGRF